MKHQHSHNVRDTSVFNTAVAFILNLSFAIIEFIFGSILGSTAILSDAVHDSGDALAVGLSWFFQRYSRKQTDADFTLGYRRFSLLGAVITSVVLIFGSILVLTEAIPKFFSPTPVKADGMFVLAIIAIAINFFGAWLLRRGSSYNESILSLHMLEDLMGWIGVLIVSIILKFTTWYWLDPLLSILISSFILVKAIPKFIEAIKILMEAMPENINYGQLMKEISGIFNVKAVNQLSVWSIDGKEHAAMIHIILNQPENCVETKASIRSIFQTYCITSSSIEVDDNAVEHLQHEF